MNKQTHNTMKTILIALWTCCLAVLNPAKAESVHIASPDGRLQMHVTDEGNRLIYRVDYQERPVVLPSQLGIDAGEKWLGDIRILEVQTAERDTVWHPVYGERSSVRDRYRACTLTLGKKGGSRSRLVLDVRAYDEGIAFRYRFPGGQYLHITGEYTEFAFPDNTHAYFTARAQTPYEYLPLANWPGESDRPLMLTLAGGTYVCLAEAQVVDYVRTKFSLAEGKRNTLATAMYGPVDEIAPYATPWRVIMAADRPGDILQNNDLLLNLNPPCEIENTAWIKPGKVMREVTLTTEGGMRLVDFAVKRRLQYIHFDAGWYGFEYDKESDATTVTLDPKRNPDPNALDLQAVIRYARSKGIGVLLYVNQRALQQQLDELLPLYKSWGVAGLKFGFVQVGSQTWTRWMHEAVKKCARYGLMVDIHDEYRPTGFSRTYPNLLTQEGIRGNEEFPDATHNTTLPFTRYVAGAADYTICYYRQDFGRLGREEDAHGVPRSRTILTTPAHQLALAAVYYSPFQFLYWYDKPSDSQDEPELKFFDDTPTVWDDTRVVQGEIGRHITVARRTGDDWFLGTITNNDGRRLTVPLDFLDPGTAYIAEVYTDGPRTLPTRTKVKTARYRVTSTTVLRFALKPSGGAALRLVKEQVKDEAVKNYRKQEL